MATQTKVKSFALEYVKTIGIVNNGSNGRGFANPYDTAIAKDGRIFVLNRCDPARAAAIRIGVCNLDEEYLGEFGYGYGEGDGQLMLPVAMAFDSGERLYVTDEHTDRITVFSPSGKFLAKWGTSGSAQGELSGPAGIAVDANDDVYVVDQANNRVQKFTNEGRFLTGFGEAGDGEGQFNLPWGLTLDSHGNIYVADWRNDRVQKFAADGRFLASFGQSGEGDGQLSRPSSVAVDDAGYVYVADWGNERVQVLNPEGEVVLKLRGQATLSKWAEDFFASNPDEMRERERSNLVPELPSHLQTPQQISAQTEPYFWGLASVTLDREGRLYATESNRHRIQVFAKR